jgi:hypothetical protein
MNYLPDNPVVNCALRAGQAIQSDMAVTLDNEGFLKPLSAGDNFRGFTLNGRAVDDDRRDVLVKFEGILTLPIEGLAHSRIGQPVFALGPYQFSVDPKSKGSKIGQVLQLSGQGNALVRYSI